MSLDYYISVGQILVSNGAFDLKFTSGNYDWDASNYEIGPFGRSLPLTTGNNRTMNDLGEIIRLQLFDDKCG